MRTYRLNRTWADPRMQRLAEWTATMMGASESTAALIGCSAEAVVAQAALESGWGSAAIGHNIFGIKAGSDWRGPKQLVWTREVFDGKAVMIQAWFRDYASYGDSIADHFDFLMRYKNYAAAGVFDPNNTKSDIEYFEALKRAGYATDPHYVDSLTNMLKSVMGFTRYMTPSDGPPPAPPPRLLMVGCAGPDVDALQASLKVAGENGFGSKTRDAVVAFQRDHKLGVDGIVGNQTRAALQAVQGAS